MVAQVLVELKAKNINKTFDYLVPKNMTNLTIGYRVLVPFGNQKLEGFVLKIEDKNTSDYELKEIIECVDEYPVLNQELLNIGEYISKKTLCNKINAYQTMLPTALKAKNKVNISKKYVNYISLNQEYSKALELTKNDKQKEIIELIKDQEKLKKELTDISLSAVNTLLKNNIIKEEKKEEYRIQTDYIKEDSNIVLTEEQNKVIKKVLEHKQEFKPFLLHGVTGSGKTEVYMQLIESALKENKGSIVLVPEISLTPQLTDKFSHRFGNNIAILHSRLSQGEKYDEWRKIEKGEVKIVIGARSAIFAPMNNLGLIVIDEEHSGTYKQENIPKYNAIDVAIFRAKYNNIPIILGSATPTIESYTRAQTGVYELLEMKNRVNNNLPKVTLIDMKEEMKYGASILSRLLKSKIEEKIQKGEQVILLLNRRGYSTITMCKNCGYVDKCPHCDIPLIYHKTSNTMRCHYCGYGSRKIDKCPDCSNTDLFDYGMGTEKLEEYIKKNIEGSKVIRMDTDTTSNKGSHEKIINAFENMEYNILIGTQMIAKGLDFPKVTLVGVMNGDAILNIPDFRSAERTFELLNQVAGRAGRSDLTGEVIIQGFNIDHYSIVKASKHDYIGFYNEEMSIRKILKYSPYYNLCLIKLKGYDINQLMTEGNKIVNYLRNKKLNETIILGPSASAMPKINNIYSVQIMLKYKNTENIINELKYIKDIYINNKINVDIDLNPLRI